MRIVSIALSCWMPFDGEHRLDLPSGAIAVVGRYGENARRSNWSGKTSLLEAVRWCLWGVHRKRLEDGLIHRGRDETWVEVRFGRFYVRRSRRRGGPTRLTVADALGTGVVEGEAAQQAVLDALGLSYEDARATVLTEQGDTEALVGRTSAQRRATVAAWLDLDLWDRAGARARTASAAAQDRLRALRAVPDEPEPRSPIDVEGDLLGAREQMRAAEDAERVAQEGLSLAQAAESAAATERDLAAVRARMRATREQVARLPVLSSDDLAAVERAHRDAEHAQRTASSEYESAKSMRGGRFDGVCPATRSACPVADRVRSDVGAIEARAIAAQNVLADANRTLYAARDAAEGPRAATREREKLTASFNAHAEQARALQARLDESAIDYLRFPSLVDAKAAVEAARRDRASAISALERLLAEQRSIVERADRVSRRATAIESAETEVRRASLVLRALSPSGIQARVASAALLSLEERANALLSGSGLSFSLAWERELSEPSPICVECGYAFRGKRDKSCPACGTVRGPKRSDELDVLVDDGSGEVEDARAKSGGARVLVATAIRLAGGLMLRERRGSRVAWALVDEPFGALDGENRESLARTFTSMLGSVGLEQALIVSHDPALLDAIPSKIVVTREGSSSRLAIEAG